MKKKIDKRGLTRREFLVTASITAAGAGIMGSPLSGLSRVYGSDKRGIRVGVIAPSHCALSMVHAQIAGNYKKNGIDVEIVYLPDMPDIAKGIISGDLQVGQLISPVFCAVNAGIGPFKDAATPLVTAQTAGTNGGVLVVAKDSGIEKPKDLVGKTIGVHNPLMVHSLLINTLLTRNQIDPAKDLNIKIIKMDDLIPAMENGEIDAFINAEPLGTFATQKEAGREMMTTEKLWFKHPCCLVAMKRDFFEKEQALAKALFMSSVESALALNNPTTRIETIQKICKDSAPYSQLPEAALQKAFQPGRSDFDPFVYQSAGKAVLRLMADSNLLPSSVNVDELVSSAYLSDLSRELLTEAGGKPPQSNTRPEKIMGNLVT